MAAHRQNPADLLQAYNANELERIARRFYDDLGDGFGVPVDIDLIVESIEGVDLDIYPALKANHKMLGMSGFNSQTGILSIYIDDKLADSSAGLRRYRMTVAEELAHVLIHRPAIEAVKTPEDSKLIKSHKKWYIYERNAKRLAAAILMPASCVLKDSRALYSEAIMKLPTPHKFSNPDSVKRMIINKLADRYLVSAEAMRYRLREYPIQILSKIDKAMNDQFDFLE